MNLEELIHLIVSPYVPESLVSPEQMDRIGRIARNFPSSLTSFFGFECRLGESDPNADFLLSITQANGERDIFGGKGKVSGFPADFAKQDAWQRIDRFAQEWNSPSSPLYSKTDNIWLEFDMDSVDTEIPVPGFFFGPVRVRSREDLKRVCSKGLVPLLGEKPDPLILQNVRTCIDILPEDTMVFQVGKMLSRDTPAVRLCIKKTTPDTICELLASLDWDGSMEELKALLKIISDYVDHISLTIDIGHKVSSKVGLECYIDSNAEANEKWCRFLDELEEIGLCRAEKKEGVLQFGGAVHRFMTRKVWPEHWLEASRQYRNTRLSTYLRNPHHIKISFEPEQGPEAKVYFGVRHIWIPTKELIEAQKNAQAQPEAGGY